MAIKIKGLVYANCPASMFSSNSIRINLFLRLFVATSVFALVAILGFA